MAPKPLATDRGPTALELLRSYVPRVVVEWLREAPEARHRLVDGTLAMVDITGFTELTERLQRRGKAGAEELADLLEEVGRLRTSAGRVRLRMSVGVHTGPVHLFLVGDVHRELLVVGLGPPYRRTFSIKGDAVNLAARVMGRAAAGQALATAAVLDRARVGFAKTPLQPFAVKGKSRTPLIGREAELAIVDQVLAGARRGEGFLATGTAVDTIAWPATVTETGFTPDASVIESASADGVATNEEGDHRKDCCTNRPPGGGAGPDDCMTPLSPDALAAGLSPTAGAAY